MRFACYTIKHYLAKEIIFVFWICLAKQSIEILLINSKQLIMQKEILEKLASEKSNPCVTISMNTHRTRPDNAQDRLLLKNLCKDAEERLLAQFTKREISPLLEKLDKIADEIDVSQNLDSLHIFLSNQTKEIIRSTWPARADSAKINDSFFVRPLIKAFNRSEEYLVLLLSQSGSKLFEALNDGIVEEIRAEGFPFPENPHVITSRNELSDSKRTDNMVREYLNKIDKAVVKDEFTVELVSDPTQPDVIDDITSSIAWDVISKKGRVIFTDQDEIRELGKIVLKTRY